MGFPNDTKKYGKKLIYYLHYYLQVSDPPETAVNLLPFPGCQVIPSREGGVFCALKSQLIFS